MRRFSIFFLTFLFLSVCPPARAIPAEGDFLPGLHRIIWGAQFNHILRRDFNKVEGEGSSSQYFIRTSYGVSERLFLDLKAGVGSVSFDRDDGIDLDFPTGFAGGYGFRYLLYGDKGPGVKSIFGFQHISCHPFKDTAGESIHRVIWDEWQGTWLLIKGWEKASFYFGPQYSSTQLKYKVDDLRRRLKTEDSWGVLVGGSYKVAENISINAETRVFDELGINFGINYRF